tara:strand:- start:24143 stop:24586 length:444 start_codon:yes stop_codon:yes gene_type:complete
MKNSFWMFFILLSIITVISSLGGGIRYRENFLEEVFDVNDALDSIVQDLSDFPKYFYSPLLNKPIISEEQVEPVVKEPVVKEQVQPKIAKPIIKQADMPSVLNMPPPPPKKTVAFDESATQVVQPVEPNNTFDVLEGFSGDMYARPL